MRTEAARWIEANIGNGTTVGIYRIDYTPPLKGDIHRNLLQTLALRNASNPELTAKLREMDRSMPIYTQLTLEYFADGPLVPEAYRGSVEVTDPKTREIFRRRWMEYDDLKRWKVRYVVLPSAGFARFLEGDPPPGGTAAHYYFTRSRDYVKQFFDREDGRYRLVKSFEEDVEEGGSSIAIVEVL